MIGSWQTLIHYRLNYLAINKADKKIETKKEKNEKVKSKLKKKR